MARNSYMKFGSSRFRLSPPAVLVLMYLGVILIGSVLLWLPLSQTGGVSFGDALFTATSAVTVTGLVVVQTGADFTVLGQGIIAALIQFGGLGLMVFAVLILSAFDIPLGMPHKVMLREDLNQATVSNLGRLVRVIALVALACEAVGAVILSFVFVPEFGWQHGIWSAVFHSISAFNNAGFSLYADSLTNWVGNPAINLVISIMFILGGLGFIVVGDIYQKRRWKTLTLHSKLMIAGTCALVVLGAVVFGALEWRNPATLGGLDSTAARLWAAWFQGVTPRTAGFNTVDTGGMGDAATLWTMALMVVGGGSTSTAGGIKVTSLIVMILATAAFFRRQSTLTVFGRSLGLEEVLKVMALATISVALMFSAVFIMSLTQEGPFLETSFEVVSAFGTVGLSMGQTSELDPLGRAVIMLVMFLGRVGPLSLGFFLAAQSTARIQYPAAKVFLG